MNAMEPKTVTLHGRAVTYAEAGSGPLLLLIQAGWRARMRTGRR